MQRNELIFLIFLFLNLNMFLNKVLSNTKLIFYKEKYINNIINSIDNKSQNNLKIILRSIDSGMGIFKAQVKFYFDKTMKNKLQKITIRNGVDEYDFFIDYYFQTDLIKVIKKIVKYKINISEESGEPIRTFESDEILEIYSSNKIFKIEKKINGQIIYSKTVSTPPEEFIKLLKRLDEVIILTKILYKKNYRYYKGGGNFYKEFILLDLEKKIKIKYTFSGPPTKFKILNPYGKEKIIYDKLMINTLKNKHQNIEIKIDSDIRYLVLRIDPLSNSKNNDLNWTLKIEFEGDEIQIG